MPNNSTQPRKILLLSANPRGTSQLRVDEEMREIKEGLRRAKKRDLYLIDTAEAVRYRDIHRAILDYEPHIIHFCGHGTGEEGLAFEDEIGQVKLVDAEALAGLFQLFADQVECVVLNACYSKYQAQEIAQHINYVVGMSQAIQDKAAIEFAVGFYDALGAGRNYEFAYKLGCNVILMAGIAQNLTPQLLKKDSPAEESPCQGDSPINTPAVENVLVEVPEATPAITPESDSIKEEHQILLANSPKDDAKIKYRQQVELLLQEDKGELSPINRSCLNELRLTLALPENEAEAIEQEALEPYRIYKEKVQRYQQVLAEAMQRQYPLSPRDETALLRFQQLLNLTDADIALIRGQMLAEREKEVGGVGEESTCSSSHLPIYPALDDKQDKQEIDYTCLRDLLKTGQWKEADEETAAVMQRIAGGEKQAWVHGATLENFPCVELNTINRLWLEHSRDRFGLSVQQQIFASVNYNWDEFGDRVGWCGKKGWFRRSEIYWKTYAELTFTDAAPVGHLPVLVVWEWRENLLSRIQACQQESEVKN